MTDPTPEDRTRDDQPPEEPADRIERDGDPVIGRTSAHDTTPNRHDREGAVGTATKTTGAFMLAGAMWPAVILAIIAVAVILYFVL